MSDALLRAWKRDTDEVARLAERVQYLEHGINNFAVRIREIGRVSHDDLKNQMKPNWSGEFVRYEDVLKLLERIEKK